MHATIEFRRSSSLSPSTTRTHRSHFTLWSVATLLFVFTASLANAKDYTRIVVFGDSLSDTGNVTHLSMAKYGIPIPGPLISYNIDYTLGRFTDGADTLPYAREYFGVWVEKLAASMPTHPEVKNSLDGGTDYAYGYAFTGDGTTTLDFNDELSVDVDNMGLQITHYLDQKPTIDSNTLFIIWGGANDVNHAGSLNDIVNAAIAETVDIQRLINAGATQFLVLNLPPLGLIPRKNGSPETSVPANAAAMLFNSWLDTGISVLHDSYGNRHLTITRLDVYSLFNMIVSNPEKFGFADVTDSSWWLGVNPDSYLFWDDLHPTTRGHSIVAEAAIKAMTLKQCTSYGLPACAAAIEHAMLATKP
jgi:outer membrane lipase/esterase